MIPPAVAAVQTLAVCIVHDLALAHVRDRIPVLVGHLAVVRERKIGVSHYDRTIQATTLSASDCRADTSNSDSPLAVQCNPMT